MKTLKIKIKEVLIWLFDEDNEIIELEEVIDELVTKGVYTTTLTLNEILQERAGFIPLNYIENTQDIKSIDKDEYELINPALYKYTGI